MKHELVVHSDEIWQRISQRLDGLSDEEYFWEPAPGCWTVRARADGAWRIDWPLPRPDPEPFTTIAWRLWHLIDMYGENRAPNWLQVPPQGDPIGMDDPDGAPPSSAVDALALLARAHDRWEAHLAIVTEEALSEKLGPVAGEYADRTRTAYVLHMLDEYIHHGAELAQMRDLWRWQHALAGTDPLVERIIRGDATVLDDIEGAPSAELVAHAARYARWDLVVALVERGAPAPPSGKTPLHFAARRRRARGREGTHCARRRSDGAR
jgi:hypothetical protein